MIMMIIIIMMMINAGRASATRTSGTHLWSCGV
jgi:hypothetical protein